MVGHCYLNRLGTKTGHFQMHKLHSKGPTTVLKISDLMDLDGLQSFMEQSSVKIKLFVLKKIGDERLALGHLDHIEAARNLGVCTSFVALGTPLETFTTVLTSIFYILCFTMFPLQF